MAPDADLKKRVGRKLTKKRREGHQVTMDIPERFRDGDDADEDCTAIQGGPAYLNQSVFGMIAAAGGSQVDFHARFDPQSSDDEEEDDAGESSTPSTPSSELIVGKTRKGKDREKPGKNRRKFSESRLLRSFPRIGSRSKSDQSQKRDASPAGPQSNTDPDPPEIQLSHTGYRSPPVMSRMLQAKEELALRPSFDAPRSSGDHLGRIYEGDRPSSLAQRLMEIFNFEKAEDVIDGRHLASCS